MILAIDIGGTKIAAAHVVNGACIDRRQLPTPDTEAEFLQTIARLATGRPLPSGIAVAVTGYVNGDRVQSFNHKTISFWDGFPLIPRLAQLLGAPVVAINDAQAAAWGEYCLRKASCQDLLFMTLSTGVGGGLVLGGTLREGSHGLAGHIGHLAIDVPPIDAPSMCGCGRLGCLEAIASGTALARQASHRFGRSMNSSELLDSARGGDAVALDIVQRASHAVASAIASAHAQLDLQVVVLGGSVGLAPNMLNWIESALHRYPAVYHVRVERATLGADSGMLGAAAWLQEQIGTHQ